jgi:hypothetical protein
MESWVDVNQKPIAAEEEGSYPDHSQEDTDAAESNLCWSVIPEASFTRFRRSMAVFNAETERPSVCLGFSAIVETRAAAREWCGTKVVRKKPNPKRDERPFFHEKPRVSIAAR